MPTKSFESFLFAFSLWVESFAIFPQLLLLKRSFKLDVINLEYIFFLGIYRLFYLLNWIYKLVKDTGSTPKVVWITGILQTLIYSDFIYQYLKMKITGTDVDLPL
ncbi:ER lumen protein retaining receptor [Histomonas meleagridis]|uniref:ER lumen protein retaining receptor n=1 Tax=Histomonas meleagridis TaxID=135588 RepID=UPI003559EFD3|nr:ER lumen protein retaining receptor [Histomonas meleagridis]KAH0796444.1 ER lumen protein retaining receptor [Histomonas meleagridis]